MHSLWKKTIHGWINNGWVLSCGSAEIWNGSDQYPDGSFQVNRDVVRAWLTVGGERQVFPILSSNEIWNL